MELPQEDDSNSQNEADLISLSSASAGSGHLPNPPAKDADKEMRNKIIQKEDWDVFKARCVVVPAGFACAAAVGIAINVFAHHNQQDSFELEVRKSGKRRNHPCSLALRKSHY
jgi:hypothetical protein